MIRPRFYRSLALAALFALALAGTVYAVDPINKTTFGGVALQGYDPVAYFTDGKPVEGSKEFVFSWQGATWRFASADHRDAFAKEPEKYAPQYGGYCAYAVAKGSTAGIDPQAWKIVDGKLYLNYNRKIQEEWLKNMASYIASADQNWPQIVKR
ncbi:MAG: YHS domain-containing (seleno)protein [Thermoanaerobaculia bacterium]